MGSAQGGPEVTRKLRARLRAAAACALLISALSTGARALENVGGVLMLEGLPFHGIGVNTPDLFERTLRDPADTAYRPVFRRLRQRGIPFVRFWCGSWGPEGYALYRDDKAEFLRRLDRFVAAAEEFHMGLIPSLAWQPQTLPVFAGARADTLAQWGDPGSATLAFFREYAGALSDRYVHSPALWGWEFGNEYNLFTDHRGDFSTADLGTALAEFARAIRASDTQHILLSGNSLPRKSAWHLATQGTWTEDSREEFGQALLRQNPDPVNTLCVHLYPDQGYPGQAATASECVRVMSGLARQAGKPLCVGEFGAHVDGTFPHQDSVFAGLLDALVANRVPMAAVWVYAFPSQDTSWNISETNAREPLLDRVLGANRQLQVDPIRPLAPRARWGEGLLWAARAWRSGIGFGGAAGPTRDLRGRGLFWLPEPVAGKK